MYALTLLIPAAIVGGHKLWHHLQARRRTKRRMQTLCGMFTANSTAPAGGYITMTYRRDREPSQVRRHG